MTIRKWKENGYQIDIRYRSRTDESVRYRAVLPINSLADAKRAHDAIEYYLKVGGPRPRITFEGRIIEWEPPAKPHRDEPDTVEALCAAYVGTFDTLRRFSKRGRASEEARVRRVVQQIGEYFLEDAETAVLTFMADVAKLNSTATQNKYRQLLQRIFGYAVDRGYLAHNPAARIPKVKVVRPKPNPLRLHEIPVFLELAWQQYPKHAAMWEFQILTGLRRGEMAALQFGDVDFEAGLIHIQRSSDRHGDLGPTKNKESRAVPLLARTAEILRQRRGDLTDRVFTNDEGGPVLPTWGKKPFKNVVGAMNRPRPTRPHDLRHTFASMLAEQGVPEEFIRVWMGHKTLSVTREYVHIDPVGPAARRSFNLVNDMVNGWQKWSTKSNVIPFPGGGAA